jgi:hypothetical protein
MTGDSNGEDPGRFDFSPWDPLGDDARLERHVGRVRAAATPELVRRQFQRSLGGMLIHWARPILTVASVIALAAATLLVRGQRHDATSERGSIAEAMGVPGSLSGWVDDGERPTTEDLWALEEVRR